MTNEVSLNPGTSHPPRSPVIEGFLSALKDPSLAVPRYGITHPPLDESSKEIFLYVARIILASTEEGNWHTALIAVNELRNELKLWARENPPELEELS